MLGVKPTMVVTLHVLVNTMLHTQDNEGYVWILTVVDHFTKYLWAEAFQSKDAGPIALYLLKTFRDGIITPERWHADNGGEFVNAYIDAVRELLAKSGINNERGMLQYSHSMPRNPQCQGLVERMNRTIKELLHKQLTNDGWVRTEHDVWDWRPYLERVVGILNRRQVKLYRVSPCVMVTGQPPEAPDHMALSASELKGLHEFCAQAQIRQAKKMEQTPLHKEFNRGDVVLVHQAARRSPADARGTGSMAWPARAIVMQVSSYSEMHYKIMWTTDGLHGRETAGDICKKRWPIYRLKLCAKTLKTDRFYDDDTLQLAEDKLRTLVMGMEDEQEDWNADEDMEGPPVRDEDLIEETAARSEPTHAFYIHTYIHTRYMQNAPS
jgi:hypothetical protein